MPSYHYQAARDTSGHIEKGLIDAENERSARNLLRARGLLPLHLERAGRQRERGPRLGRISQAQLGWLTRQLAGLLVAGLPLESALTATLEQADTTYVKQVLGALRADIRAGQRLCDAMASQSRDFPDVYRALIETGEQSGDLGRVMEKLADYTEAQSRLRNKIVTAMVYPAIVSFVAVLIVLFLLGYVVPQVVGAFSHTGQTLPLATRFLLAISQFVRQWGWLTLFSVVGVVILARLSLRSPSVRLRWHARMLKLPIAGRYILGVNTERFAATLAILGTSGVPLLAALEASSRTVGNACLQRSIHEAAAHVREGSSLAAALRSRKIFPPLLVHLVESGERTGALPAMLQRAAATLANELEQRALRLTALLEPLLTLLMGGVVMFIVLAIMLPILQINQMIQ
jgi:general secretion pathway protein F